MGFLSSIILFIVLSKTSFYHSILHLPIVAANDVLLPGDKLDTLDTASILVSSNGMFTLGSISFTTNISYFGIWVTNQQNDMVVWIANREIPIVGDGILTLDDSGTLRVMNGSGATLFNISNNKVSSTNKNDTRAMLLDTGNFIVYDEGNHTIWQSFDHPTDNLLPGMKIGYNLTTGQNWTLTSWADDNTPTSGAFNMRLEQYQNSPQLLIYRHGQLYWASGPWIKDSGYFEFLVSMTFDNFGYEYNMKLISDASGMYFTYETTLFISSILQLSLNGQLVDSTQNIDQFTPGFCGFHSNGDRGCVVSTNPNCRVLPSPYDSYYWQTSDYISTSGRKTYDDNSSISLGDCMERCWNDCNCSACSTYNNGTGCIYWSEYDLFGEYQESGQVYYLDLTRYHRKKIWRWILFSLLFVPISILGYVWIKRRIVQGKENRRREDMIHQMTGSNSFNYGDELERGIKDAPDVKVFSLKAILAATNNFSDDNKLGQGGYGPVYKGELSDGREIAVKRLSKTSGQGILEFKSELVLISKLQHINLVRLYGCCIHQEEKMLIYEFMPNKSLDFFLFAQDEKEKIGWQMRFNIIEGVAQGLLYLHKYSRMKVIHRDLKVGNVLLDENMNPKISDFGMARIFQKNVTEAVTKRVVGTYGYMAPEYAMEGTFSIKSDVFSFGVLILEIVSGRKNSSFYNPNKPLNLVGYAWELWKGHASLELKDETLGESFDVKQLLRVIHVGLLCVQDNADDRPTMSDVIYVLQNENIDLPSPKKPAFFTGRQTAGFHLNEARSAGYVSDRPLSEINLTITTMEAR